MREPFESAVDAVVSGDIIVLKSLLEECPSLPRARSSRPHRATLLHYAAANGVEDERQMSPQNAPEVVQVLVEAGADVDALCDVYRGGPGSTTLILTLTSAHPARAGTQAKIVGELCRSGAAVDGVDGRGGPLAAATAFMYPPAGFLEDQYRAALESVEVLLKWGAQIQDAHAAIAAGPSGAVPIEALTGETARSRALALACLTGKLDAVRTLLDASVGVDATYAQGETGLHLAASCGHTRVAELLVQRRADRARRDDRHGETPLEWARRYGSGAIVRLLDQ